MSSSCPSCGTPVYGAHFCVSCQQSLPGPVAVPRKAAVEEKAEVPPVVRAGFLRRFAAFFIDWLLLSVIADIVRFTYRFGSDLGPGAIRLDLAMSISALLFVLYFTLLTGDGGQTLGKMVLGIRVRRLDGSPVGYGRSFLRALGYFVSMFFGSFLGFLWALWDKKNQTWHDKIAGTEVIKV